MHYGGLLAGFANSAQTETVNAIAPDQYYEINSTPRKFYAGDMLFSSSMQSVI